jgi:hypothetical protein
MGLKIAGMVFKYFLDMTKSRLRIQIRVYKCPHITNFPIWKIQSVNKQSWLFGRVV